MRRSCLVLATVAATLLVEACSGGNATPPLTGSTAATSSSLARLPASDVRKPHFLRLMHTPPFPPKHWHRVTGEERARARAAGWTPLSNVAAWTNGPDTPLLMTDGTVMVHDYCTPNWYSLAPDKNGNYVTGTWTKAASMPSNYGPLPTASNSSARRLKRRGREF